MNFRPFQHRTIVSGLKKDKVIKQIEKKTQLVNSEFITENAIFNGKIKENRFRISENIRVAQNSLPLITGQVDDTSRGSIIFLKFRLFPAALLYLRFSSLICGLCALVFLLMAKFVAASLIAIALALINYIVLVLNFHKKADQAFVKLSEILKESD